MADLDGGGARDRARGGARGHAHRARSAPARACAAARCRSAAAWSSTSSACASWSRSTPTAGAATFEAGIIGEHLEHELNRRGFTLGHFPSSIMCSTFGGWLAARSAGQLSTSYGKIEDMVRRLTFVDGRGDSARARVGASPDLAQLLVGTEGTLGVITRADLHGAPAPEARLYRGWSFPRVRRRLRGDPPPAAARARPCVVRLYDELDSFLHRRSEKRDHAAASRGRGARRSGCRMLAPPARAARRVEAARHRRRARAAPRWSTSWPARSCPTRRAAACSSSASRASARWPRPRRAPPPSSSSARAASDLGPGPGERWLAHRYAVSFRMSKVFDAGAFVDTMEVATTWDRLLELYRAVRAAVSPLAFVMAHFSHAYADGCSIYFTFAARGSSRADAERKYDDIWRAGLAAAQQVGATISHHHGVGPLEGAVHARGARRVDGDLPRAQGRARSRAHHEPGEDGPVIEPLLSSSDLPSAVRRRSTSTARRLARADARGRARRPRSPTCCAWRAKPASPSAWARARASSLDLSRMRNVLHLDETSLLVTVQAGITAEALEALLARARPHAGAAAARPRARAPSARCSRRRARRRRRRAGAASPTPAPAWRRCSPTAPRSPRASRRARRPAPTSCTRSSARAARSASSPSATLRLSRRGEVREDAAWALPSVTPALGLRARAPGPRRPPARSAGGAVARDHAGGHRRRAAPLVESRARAVPPRSRCEHGGRPVPHTPPPLQTAPRRTSDVRAARARRSPSAARRPARVVGWHARRRRRRRSRARRPEPPPPPLIRW